MKKATLCLLPGLLCDRTVWADQLAGLSDVANMWVADFRGYRSLADMAARVLEEARGCFSLAGHSMGGRVALEVCRLAPARVERIALLDTGYRPPGEGEAERRQAFVDLARREGVAAVAAAWMPNLVHPSRLGEGRLTGEIAAMMQRYALAELEGQIEALLRRPDASEVLRTIGCPVLIACGRQDSWSPQAQHEEMAALAPHAVLEIIEDCGHMSPMERPAQVNELLRRWLG